MKPTKRAIVYTGAFAFPIIAAVAYVQKPPSAPTTTLDRSARFFWMLDSVLINTPALKFVSSTRSQYPDIPESLSSRDCRCDGFEVRTLQSIDGLELRVAATQFAISGDRLQKSYPSVWSCRISDPWYHLSEMFIDGQLVRAIEDKELQITVGATKAPVRYAKWQEPNGSFTHAYAAWSTDGSWVIPLDSSFSERYNPANLSPHEREHGVEIIRIDIRAKTKRESDQIPLELIEQVLQPFNAKLRVSVTSTK